MTLSAYLFQLDCVEIDGAVRDAAEEFLGLVTGQLPEVNFLDRAE